MNAPRIAALTLASGLALALASACADSETDLPGGKVDDGSSSGDSGATLPPPSNGSSGDTSSGSNTSGSGGTPTDSGTSSSGGDSGNTGNVPACSFNQQQAFMKLQEILAGAPCDNTCNPTTHCCFDLAGFGGGGSSGLPIEAGGGGLPSGVCVSK